MLNLLQDPQGLLKEPKKLKPRNATVPDFEKDRIIRPDIKKAGYLARYKTGRISGWISGASQIESYQYLHLSFPISIKYVHNTKMSYKKSYTVFTLCVKNVPTYLSDPYVL